MLTCPPRSTSRPTGLPPSGGRTPTAPTLTPPATPTRDQVAYKWCSPTSVLPERHGTSTTNCATSSPPAVSPQVRSHSSTPQQHHGRRNACLSGAEPATST